MAKFLVSFPSEGERETTRNAKCLLYQSNQGSISPIVALHVKRKTSKALVRSSRCEAQIHTTVKNTTTVRWGYPG